MSLLKNIILLVVFASLIYFGGAGTQSDSTSLQGMGFVSVVIGLIVLYILFKIFWSAMSMSMALLVIGGVVWFILYSLGMLGSDSVTQKLGDKFFSANEPSVEYAEAQQQNGQMADLEPIGTDENNGSVVNATPSEDDGGFFSKVSGLFGTKQEPAQINNFNPMDYPALKGVPRVITGSVLKIKGIRVKLLGVDAPNSEQICSNSKGISYHCGQKAITWLQDWIHEQEVECRIVGDVINRRATGVCFLGQHDIGAAIVSAGWAVAYTKNTNIYLPYEKQARNDLQGMWNGRFYRPADWRKLQKRRAKIESNKGSDWLNFDGWF